MLGLGESEKEIYSSLDDLKNVGVDGITFGQYLSPTSRHKKYLPVEEYLPHRYFQEIKLMAEEMGFRYVASGPLVRRQLQGGGTFHQGHD